MFASKQTSMERILLLSHAFSGGIVLLLGLISFLDKKGSKSHILIGKIYVGTTWWICLSALFIISFYRFSFFLLVIGVLTFYASFVGVRVVRRKKSSSEKWYDWLVSGLTSLFGIGLLVYGCYLIIATQSAHILGILSVIFGGFTARSGILDLRHYYSEDPDEKFWWLHQHISAMGGSYIAAITAFAVQNNRIFLPDGYGWLAWLMPAILFSPLLSLMKRRFEGRFKKAKTIA
ncbi:MAG: putative membrane protein [Marinoscillum sp.]